MLPSSTQFLPTIPVPDEPTHRRRYRPQSLSAADAPAVRRLRLRRADLRDRLVSGAVPHRRLQRHFHGRRARHLHGRDVRGIAALFKICEGRRTSAACLCEAGSGHCCVWTHHPVRAALRRWTLHVDGRPRFQWTAGARTVLRALSGASHHPHGRHAAGRRALGTVHPIRCELAWIFLRREHRRRRVRMSARGVLSAAVV